MDKFNPRYNVDSETDHHLQGDVPQDADKQPNGWSLSIKLLVVAAALVGGGIAFLGR